MAAVTSTTSSDDDFRQTRDNTIIPQCELLAEGSIGAKLAYDQCQHNPGHKRFMTMTQFEDQTLPEFITDKDMAHIKNVFDRTVKIVVPYTSKNRPDKYHNSETPYPYIEYRGKRKTRCGTGLIVFDNTAEQLNGLNRRGVLHGKCPCPDCKGSDNHKMEFWQVAVITAAHVIFDNVEASRAKFQVFYDSEHTDGPEQFLYGKRVFPILYNGLNGHNSDYTETICVTHDPELGQRILQCLDQIQRKGILSGWGSTGVLISHPHGVDKRITMGNIQNVNHVFIPEEYVPLEKQKVIVNKGTRITWSESDDKEAGYTVDQSDDNDSSSGIDTTRDNDSKLTEREGDRKDVESDPTTNSINRFIDLPCDMIVNIPPEANYFVKDELNPDSSKYNFPPGTTLSPKDGSDMAALIVPKDAKLSFTSMDSLTIGPNFLPHYVTYDIPTCGGSSGAFLITKFSRHLTHFGCRDYRENFSGLGRSI